VVERGNLDAVPLEQLLPGIDTGCLTRIRAAAASLDAARPRGDAPTWYWHPEHATFPGFDARGSRAVLETGVATGDRSDWTELDLDFRWNWIGMREVTATLDVACFCDEDHNVHQVEELALLAASYGALSAQLERAVEQVHTWLAGPLEPAYWRDRAGLPQP